MRYSTLSVAALAVFVLSLSAQYQVREVGPAPASGAVLKQDAKQEDVSMPDLLDALKDAMSEIEALKAPITKVRKILDEIDEKSEQVEDKTELEVNRLLRSRLLEQLRDLRNRAKRLLTRVRIDALPMKRALLAKISRAAASEENPELRSRYAKLAGELQQDIELLGEQSEILRAKVIGIENGIRKLEGHLDYLGMVEESIKLGNKLGESMRDLNKQLEELLDALGVKVKA